MNLLVVETDSVGSFCGERHSIQIRVARPKSPNWSSGPATFHTFPVINAKRGHPSSIPRYLRVGAVVIDFTPH